MSDDFMVWCKSTLDKIMTDLVDQLEPTFDGLQGSEVDNTLETDKVFKAKYPALLWQFLTAAESPRDPLYRVTFLVGAKTVSDSGNYDLSKLNGELRKTFKTGDRLSVRDYSGAVASVEKGYLVISDNILSPQQYDHMNGVRFFAVTAVGARLV